METPSWCLRVGFYELILLRMLLSLECLSSRSDAGQPVEPKLGGPHDHVAGRVSEEWLLDPLHGIMYLNIFDACLVCLNIFELFLFPLLLAGISQDAWQPELSSGQCGPVGFVDTKRSELGYHHGYAHAQVTPN